MKVEAGDNSMINLSVQQVLSLWAHGTVLRHLTAMIDYVFNLFKVEEVDENRGGAEVEAAAKRPS